jgi:4-hydroxybenzoate polyprenyltransferase
MDSMSNGAPTAPAAQHTPLTGLVSRIRATLEMIKFGHSIFALPFALTGAVLAARGWPSWRQLLWITAAMVAARSAAMAFNRIADVKFDALNPRTSARALPSGQLTLAFAIGFTAVSCGVLVLAAYELNPLAFKLSPLVLLLLLGYSYTKRFTSWSHLVLGTCLGLSPVAAWTALRGDVEPAVLMLGGAVMFWVAGFDLIYACQDVDFDRRQGLFSIPARYGIRTALWLSGLMHMAMLILLMVVARMENLGWLAFAGLALVAALLAYEHGLVRPADLSRLDAAFFNINGYVSVLFFLTWAGDLLIH